MRIMQKATLVMLIVVLLAVVVFAGSLKNEEIFKSPPANQCTQSSAEYAKIYQYCNNCKKNASCFEQCCVNDDGYCFKACNKDNDNDCYIKEKLEKIHEFLKANKSIEGFTPDTRQNSGYPVNPVSEYYRLNIGSQALGYLNLYKSSGEKKYLREAEDRLNYLSSLNETKLWIKKDWDGYVGYAFLLAYEFDCNKTYKNIGLEVANRCLGYNGELNWGLMCAWNLAQAYKITKNKDYLDEARRILARTQYYQNEDGSFPHQSNRGNRSLPYSSFMGFEFVIYQNIDPRVTKIEYNFKYKNEEYPFNFTKILKRLSNLLEKHIDENGKILYVIDTTDRCISCSTKRRGVGCVDYCNYLCGAGDPENPVLLLCWCIIDPIEDCLTNQKVITYYYDEENPNYDTRGWTSELASTAITLSGDKKVDSKWNVLNFLFNLQNGDSSFPDKWDYLPEPSNTYWYIWSDPNSSVMRTSAIFFELSEILQKPNIVNKPNPNNKTSLIKNFGL